MLKWMVFAVCAGSLITIVFCAPEYENNREKQYTRQDVTDQAKIDGTSRTKRNTLGTVDIVYIDTASIDSIKLKNLQSKESSHLAPVNDVTNLRKNIQEQPDSNIELVSENANYIMYKVKSTGDPSPNDYPENKMAQQTFFDNNQYYGSHDSNHYSGYSNNRPLPPPHRPYENKSRRIYNDRQTRQSSQHRGRGPPHHGGPSPHHDEPPPHHDGPPPHHGRPPPHHGGPHPHHSGPHPHHDGRPHHHGGPPSHQGGPPQHHVGPPPHHGGPPPHHGGPPSHHGGPPPHHGGSPPRHEGPPERFDGVPPDRFDGRPPDRYEDRPPYDQRPPSPPNDGRPPPDREQSYDQGNKNNEYTHTTSTTTTIDETDDEYQLDVRFSNDDNAKTMEATNVKRDVATTLLLSPYIFQAAAVRPVD